MNKANKIILAIAAVLLLTLTWTLIRGLQAQELLASQNKELQEQLEQLTKQEKRSAVMQRVNAQLEEIANEERRISEEQRDAAEQQTEVAEQMRRQAEEERQNALVAEQRALEAVVHGRDVMTQRHAHGVFHFDLFHTKNPLILEKIFYMIYHILNKLLLHLYKIFLLKNEIFPDQLYPIFQILLSY